MATEVTVDSLRYDSNEAVLWTSNGDGTYTVAQVRARSAAPPSP